MKYHIWFHCYITYRLDLLDYFIKVYLILSDYVFQVFRRRKEEFILRKADSNARIIKDNLINVPEINGTPFNNENKIGLRDDLDEIDENDIGWYKNKYIDFHLKI